MDALMAAAENLCLIHGDVSGVFKPDLREESASQVVQVTAEAVPSTCVVKPSLDFTSKRHASAPEYKQERTEKQVMSVETKEFEESKDDAGGNSSGTTGPAFHPSPSRKFCAKLEAFAASAALVEAEENHGGPLIANELKDQLYDSLPVSSPDADSFNAGDLVWAKVKSHPWWPGQIFDAEDASKVAKKKQKPDRLLVAFFGDGTYAWLQVSQLLHFKSHFSKNVKQTTTKSFCNAIEEALEEVCRRSELGLSCSCHAEILHSTSSFPDRNIGIQEMGLRLRSHRDISRSKEMLSSKKLLEFVIAVARSPFGCWNSSFEASELRGHAFGVRTGIAAAGRSSTSVPLGELKGGVRRSHLNPPSKRKVSTLDGDGMLEASEGTKLKKTKSSIVEVLQKPSCTPECLTELSQSQQSGSKRKATEVFEGEAHEGGQQGATGVEGRISGLEVKSVKRANADCMTESGAKDDMETLLAIGGFNSKLLRKGRKVNKCMVTTSVTKKGKLSCMLADHAQSCTSSNASSPNMSIHDSSATSCVQGTNQLVSVPAEQKGNLDQNLLDHVKCKNDPFVLGADNANTAGMDGKVEYEGLSNFSHLLDREVQDSVITSMKKDSSEACAISHDNQAQADAVICTPKGLTDTCMVGKASAASDSSFIPSSNQQGEALNSVTQLSLAQADVVEKPVKATVMAKDMENKTDNAKDTLLVAKHGDAPQFSEVQADVVKESLKPGENRQVGDERGTCPLTKHWDVPLSVEVHVDVTEKPGMHLDVIEDTKEATGDVSGTLLVPEQEEIRQSFQANAASRIVKAVEGTRDHTGHATCLVIKPGKDQASAKKISSIRKAKQSSNKVRSSSTSAVTSSALNEAGYGSKQSHNVLLQHVNCLKLLARDSLSKASLGNRVDEAIAPFMRFRELFYLKSPGYGEVLPRVAEQNVFKKPNTHVKTDPGHLSAQSHLLLAPSSPKNEMHELLLAARKKKSEILQEEKTLRDREKEFIAQKRQLSKLGIKSTDGDTGNVVVSDTRVLPRRSADMVVGLFMKFPRGFTIPSESQLRDMFMQFGALKSAGTKVYKNAASARVVFKRAQDAEVAFKCAKRKRLFGDASIVFRLKRLSEPGRLNEKESFLPTQGETKVTVRDELGLPVQSIQSPERQLVLHSTDSETAFKEEIFSVTDQSVNLSSTFGSDRHSIPTPLSSDILDAGRAYSDADECMPMPSPSAQGPSIASCNVVGQVRSSVDGDTSKLPALNCGHEELSISGPTTLDVDLTRAIAKVEAVSATAKVEAVSVATEAQSQGDLTCNMNHPSLNTLPGVNQASRDIQDQLLKLLQQVSVLMSSPK